MVSAKFSLVSFPASFHLNHELLESLIFSDGIARQHFVENHSQTPEVGPRINGETARLFWRSRSTSPKFRQIYQDDICIFLQTAEDDFFTVRRDIEVVDEELTTEVGKLTLQSSDQVH